jgi:hypothetical protein
MVIQPEQTRHRSAFRDLDTGSTGNGPGPVLLHDIFDPTMNGLRKIFPGWISEITRALAKGGDERQHGLAGSGISSFQGKIAGTQR